jgi:hypothetical protein
LERPENCPINIYDVMLKCWQWEPYMRPTFEKIHSELENLFHEFSTSASISTTCLNLTNLNVNPSLINNSPVLTINNLGVAPYSSHSQNLISTTPTNQHTLSSFQTSSLATRKNHVPPPRPPERSCSFKDVENLQHINLPLSLNAENKPTHVMRIDKDNLINNLSPNLNAIPSSTSTLSLLSPQNSNVNNINVQKNPFSIQSNHKSRPKSRVFTSNGTSNESYDLNQNSNEENKEQNKTSLNLRQTINIINNKFGTLPSKISNKNNSKITKNNEQSNENDLKEEKELNEFQRVFNQLKKQPKEDENSTKPVKINEIDEDKNKELNIKTALFKSTQSNHNLKKTSDTENLTIKENKTPIDAVKPAIAQKKASHFERFIPTRSSTTNLIESNSSTRSNQNNSSSHSTSTTRSSFNLHHSKSLSNTIQKDQSPNPKSNNSTVEYACFNIKPSQYKQTGIFLPVNNNSSSISSLNGKGKELSVLKIIKDDLELLIQKLRNLQKEKNSLVKSCDEARLIQQLEANLTNFLKSINDFSDRTSQELNILLTDSSLVSAKEELVQKVKQLLAQIKSNNIFLFVINHNGFVMNDFDTNMIQLSKNFTEFMQVLDKMTCVFTQQAILNKNNAQ